MLEQFAGFSGRRKAREALAPFSPSKGRQTGLSIGTEHSFSEKLADIRPDLRAYLGSFLNREADVDDCFQEVSIVLWNRHGADWTIEDFRRFGFKVARNRAAYLLRKQKRAPVLGQELTEEIASRIEAMSATGDDRDTRITALRKCLGSLSGKHRQIVETRYFGSGSLKGLAGERGDSESSIYKRLERIRTALRDCVIRQLERL